MNCPYCGKYLQSILDDCYCLSHSASPSVSPSASISPSLADDDILLAPLPPLVPMARARKYGVLGASNVSGATLSMDWGDLEPPKKPGKKVSDVTKVLEGLL